MFNIGDYIVYPMHGAGVIEAIEEKEVLGETRKYYVIKMPMNNMNVMIPIAQIENSRIRMVADLPMLDEALDVFHHGASDTTLTWKERFKTNMEKMKSGELSEGAEVVRDLLRINKAKTLNSSERQMLDSARRIFVSELGIVKGVNEIQAMEMLNEEWSC
ncbi:CarD family transcriptional regulator [Bacillus marasmi]|uniref:CarD family transcriptional regulator n=1 Tax=Bacillus marasmi TaxID=1926279 RepID=UPI0011C8229E|nr:CarD family transcriptional regulator [Bacillus marasmi]